MSARGKLTGDIAKKAKEFLGREITEDEFRLYPYLQYQMVNERRIDPRRINQVEREVMSKLRAEGHIEGGAGGLAMTREFYLFISDLLFDGYAAYDDDDLKSDPHHNFLIRALKKAS